VRSVSNEALEQRVYAVEKGLTAFGERLESVATNIDGRFDRLINTIDKRFAELSADRKPPYQAFTIIATVSIFVLTSFGALSVAFIQGRINGVEERTKENHALIEQYVPRRELQQWQENMTDRSNRLGDSLVQLRDTSVTKDSFQGVVDTLARHDQQLAAITPTSNVIQDILDRLKRLEDRKAGWGVSGGAP
jgi:hypothetical protein